MTGETCPDCGTLLQETKGTGVKLPEDWKIQGWCDTCGNWKYTKEQRGDGETTCLTCGKDVPMLPHGVCFKCYKEGKEP